MNVKKRYGNCCFLNVGQCPNVLLHNPFFVSNSLKGLQKTLRSKWLRGPVSKFDKLLSRIAKVDLETAQKIRESQMELDILAYDKRDFQYMRDKLKAENHFFEESQKIDKLFQDKKNGLGHLFTNEKNMIRYFRC